MKTKIIVIENAGDLVEALTSALGEAKQPCTCRNKPSDWFEGFDSDEDNFDEDDFDCCNYPEERPLPRWGVAGTPADPRMRFGASFTIDEPRQEDYAHRWQFESDHAAFDRFVEAGEDCVARQMEKKNEAPIHKCQAVRRRLEDGPVMNLPLIGETQWW